MGEQSHDNVDGREYKSQQRREYHQANKARENQRNKEYYYANRERISQQRKEQYQANREHVKQRNKDWDCANKETRSQYFKEWYQANKEHVNQRNRERRHLYKETNKKRYYKYSYGLTLAEFQALLQAQNGECAICGKAFTDDARPYVDHCHETGDVRGILCQHCNTGIGFLKDSPVIVSKALEYLNMYAGKECSA